MIDRVLVLLLAGCALFGAVIFVELTSDDAGGSAGTPVARPPETGTPPRAQGPRVDDLLMTILGRPLFSPTRQAAARKSPDRPADLDLADMRLTGIVIEPGRRFAIFAVLGAKPIVRSEGETMNDWRVDSITPGEVVLSGPAGRATLQPKIDPNLARRAAGPPRPGQVAPPAAIPGAPRAASPAAATPPARLTGPGIAAPAPPGAAPPKPASMPAVTPPGTPMPPPRVPGAAGGRE